MAFQIDFYDSTAEFINRLEKFDQEVSKELKKDMRNASKHVVSAAQAMWGGMDIHPSGWTREWFDGNGRDLRLDRSRARSGVKTRMYRARARGKVVAFGYYVVQTDPAAAIFEIVGSGKRVTDPAGQQLVNVVNEKHGSSPRPRVLYPSYYAGMPKAQAEIEAAVEAAARKVGQ